VELTLPTKCKHNNVICEECVKVSDAAKRFSDGINAMLTFNKPWEIRYSWVAIKLQDGSVDSAIYDTRGEAIKHQSDERLYCYFPIGNFLNGLKAADAQLLLDIQRHAYDQGFRITDEKTPDLITPVEQVDMLKAFQRYRSANVN
jgi:hypothetical protein